MTDMSVQAKIYNGAYTHEWPKEPDPVLPMVTISAAQVHLIKQRAHSKWRSEQNEKQAILTAQFQRDLEEEHGLVGHPMAGKLFSLAWQRGHSSGFGDIYVNYTEMAELLAHDPMRKRLVDGLKEAILQLEYLDTKYFSGSTPTVITRLNQLLKELGVEG